MAALVLSPTVFRGLSGKGAVRAGIELMASVLLHSVCFLVGRDRLDNANMHSHTPNVHQCVDMADMPIVHDSL